MNNSTINSISCALSGTHVTFLVFYALVFLIGTIGNTIVLVVFLKTHRYKDMLGVSILYLAFFDLLSSICAPLLFSYWIVTCNQWYLGYGACKVLPSSIRIFNNLSFGFLMVMAIDRYRIITASFRNRLKRYSLRRMHGIAMLVICLCILWETPYIYFLRIIPQGCFPIFVHKYDSLPETILFLVKTVGFIGVITVPTLFSYTSLRRASIDRSRTFEKSPRTLRRSPRAMRMLLSMAIVAAVTILPRDIFIVYRELNYFITNDYLAGANETVFYINSALKLLQTSNSIYNVFIYTGHRDRFWRNTKSIFCGQDHRDRCGTEETKVRSSSIVSLVKMKKLIKR